MRTTTRDCSRAWRSIVPCSAPTSGRCSTRGGGRSTTRLSGSSCTALSKATGPRTGAWPMVSVDRLARVVACAAAFVCVAPAIAGGPLLVVPKDGTVKPARWEGIVNVYIDQGTLGVLDNAQATQLVANAVAQWSSVPTSSFRAQI